MAASSEASWKLKPEVANPVLMMRLATGPGKEESRRRENVSWLLSWTMPTGTAENPDRTPIVLTETDVDAVIELIGEKAAVSFVGRWMSRPAA